MRTRTLSKSSLVTAGALLALLALASPSGSQDQEAKRAKVRRFLVVSGQAAVSELSYENMLEQFASNPQLGPRFAKKFREMTQPSDLAELVVPVLERNLTDEELAAGIAFYETPAGKRLAELQPTITQESMEAGQRWGAEMAMKVMQALQGGGGEDEGEDY